MKVAVARGVTKVAFLLWVLRVALSVLSRLLGHVFDVSTGSDWFYCWIGEVISKTPIF